MQTSNKKIFDNLVSRTKIYLVIILILLLGICWQNKMLIIPSIIIYALILGYTYFANNKRKSEISETLQDLTLTVDSAAKTSLINSPFPLIILETDGNVVWKSSKFATEFEDIEEERRLFYVAMTRAKDSLYLTAYKKDGEGDKETNVSPFIEECNI